MEEKIEKYALSLGFDLVGYTPSRLPEKYIKAHEEWLTRHYEGEMAYMRKPRTCEGKSVIVLAKNYYSRQSPLKRNQGRVARYAYARDYHKIIGKKLKELEKYIKQISSGARTKSYVDTGPVPEKAYAQEANIGFIGKNSCLITPEFGSWVFLAVIFTDLKLKANRKRIKISCGTCNRCIEACPTGAIAKGRMVDSRKCISYHTIENRDQIPKAIGEQIRATKRVFGCDICQEVCPHNLARQKALSGDYGENGFFGQRIAGESLSSKDIPQDEQKFTKKFAGSPLMRAKRKGLERNMRITRVAR